MQETTTIAIESALLDNTLHMHAGTNPLSNFLPTLYSPLLFEDVSKGSNLENIASSLPP